MEQLPVETLTHALKLLDISSRISVKLTSCNHTLQQRVYRECSEAWKELKFYDMSHLTDLDLSRLLIRVNAREVTEILCLMPRARVCIFIFSCKV
jgi:hypothetical protein